MKRQQPMQYGQNVTLYQAPKRLTYASGYRPRVIARSEATKQSPARESRRTCRAGDCFVASLLAMTGNSSGSPPESRSFGRRV